MAPTVKKFLEGTPLELLEAKCLPFQDTGRNQPVTEASSGQAILVISNALITHFSHTHFHSLNYSLFLNLHFSSKAILKTQS